MTSNEVLLHQYIINTIDLANKLNINMDELKNKINREINHHKPNKINKKNRSKKKPMRPPLWISDSSSDET